MKKIRTATLTDVPAMLEIYRYYVLETPISLELEPPSLEEFQNRVAQRLGKLPWLVCEIDSQIVGYAYGSHYHTRPGYTWTLEATVYLRQSFQGKGLGSELYEVLLNMLKEQGAVNVIGGITLPNEASVRLHERFGFKAVSQIKDAGFKMGRWWDIGHWQLQFEKPDTPKPLSLPPVLK